MKKVLSVALASAMVLGMGANAFAITYSTGSSEKADWPKNFEFEGGSLFVTDKDGNLVEESTTALDDSEAVDFQPGDVIWMPLFADDQKVYDAKYEEGSDDVDAVTSVKLEGTKVSYDSVELYTIGSKTYRTADDSEVSSADLKGWYKTNITRKGDVDGTERVHTTYIKVTDLEEGELPASYADRTVKANSTKYYVGTSSYRTPESAYAAYAKNMDKEFYVTVDLEKVEGEDESVGKPTTGETVAHGHYTGNIDKNWSINLIEDMGYAEEIVEKAELYKATATDYASYSRFNNNAIDIQPNAVYLKVTLKKEWKIKDSVDMKYYVYVADNAGNKTDKVWVSGTYAPTTKTVDFTWTNDASEPAIWEAKESGTATFDFADKAFFTVKMYKGETMYLDLSTAYDKAIAGEMDAEADSFYKFDSENANFSRTGTLMIVSDDETLVPYEVDKDGNFVAVEADYVENYAVAHTNKKVNGFVFNTKQLGNYVLSTEELGTEEEVVEEPTTEEPVVEEPVVEEPVVEETNKPNPNTGAEDFVGLAVSLAVVSVAAAGALALKK